MDQKIQEQIKVLFLKLHYSTFSFLDAQVNVQTSKQMWV